MLKALEDYIHILISTSNDISPKELVTRFKKESNYRIWRCNVEVEEYLKKFLWNKHVF
jgi:REP element-mobilizing transposase RayT